MQDLRCGREDLIDYECRLGRGTHGLICGSRQSANQAFKLFPYVESACAHIRAGEYGIHDSVKRTLDQAKLEGLTRGVECPAVYGFYFFPSALDPRCCGYAMDRIEPLPGLKKMLHLSFEYPRDHFTESPAGFFAGMDAYGRETGDDVGAAVAAVAETFAVLHFGLMCDGYDIEFVRGQRGIHVVDFDKCSMFTEVGDAPYTIRRKITEEDYEIRLISREFHVQRLLATALGYLPQPREPEFQVFVERYTGVAARYGQEARARGVIEMFAQAL